MNPIQSTAMTVRNRVLARSRRNRIAELAAQGRVPGNVAFYHRVADTTPNGWTMSRSQFQDHVDYLQSEMQIVDLAEIQRRVREEDSRDQCINVTFDDGYADNVDFAIPLLIERGIACTYFVTTQNIVQGRPFAHDVACGNPLAPNTVSQIREMARAGIEIGCHTRTHVDFSKVHSPEEVRQEIIDAKDELEQMIGREVRYFAFPFGLPAQLTQVAIEAVHEAGFAGFCSAYGAYNQVGGDWFHIRRFHGDPEFQRLVNWCSYDVSKTQSEPEIRYFLPPANSSAQTSAIMPSLLIQASSATSPFNV